MAELAAAEILALAKAAGRISMSGETGKWVSPGLSAEYGKWLHINGFDDEGFLDYCIEDEARRVPAPLSVLLTSENIASGSALTRAIVASKIEVRDSGDGCAPRFTANLGGCAARGWPTPEGARDALLDVLVR